MPNERRWPLILIMLCLAAAAWLWVLDQARSMSSECGMCSGMSVVCPMCMGTHRPLWVSLPSFLVMWATMMVAMMLPALTPMALVYSKVAARRRALGNVASSVAFFVTGYLLAWAASGLFAFAVARVIQRVIGLFPDLASAHHLAAGSVLLAAGVYQLSSIKDRCLRHCRTPLHFVLHAWRDTRLGAVRMGCGHALYCIGCCWGLMAVMFAVGLMNLWWMVGLSVVMALEKIVPQGKLVSRLSGVALLGVGVFFAVQHVTG